MAKKTQVIALRSFTTYTEKGTKVLVDKGSDLGACGVSKKATEMAIGAGWAEEVTTDEAPATHAPSTKKEG